MAEETRGICVRDVPAKAFIAAYAEHFAAERFVSVRPLNDTGALIGLP